MDKRKRFKLNLEVFRDIFRICPRVQGQDFDALPTDEEIVSFLRDLGHTGEIHSLNDVVVNQMHQPWKTFAALINRSLFDFIYQIDNKAYKKQEKMYYPRFTKVIIHHFLTQDKTVSWRNKIGMHTSKDDYLINTLRFVSAKEETQIYGAILPDSLTSPEMKHTNAYKTYLVSAEEPTGKSKRVKRPTKKTTKAPARRRKRWMLLETHQSGSDTVTKTAPSAAKIKPSVTSEGTDDSNNEQESSGEDSDQKNDSDNDKTQSDNENELNSEHETDENILGSESDQDKNEEDEDDEEEVKDELVKTPSNDSDDEDETKITDKAEGDEDEEMDYTTSQLYDDVDIRLNEPVDIDKIFPIRMKKLFLQGMFTSIKKFQESKLPHSLLYLSQPPPTTEATNPLSTLPNFASIFQFNNKVTTLKKEVIELKKDPLHTQVTALVDDHLDARLGATREEFMNFLSASLTARITEQV
ncbi:hypothetical protein Tco_1438968 [Tanacetum coccineum]